MWMIAVILFVGLVAGWVASLVVRRERRPSDWGLLLAVGIGGSLLGGIVVNLVRGNGLALRFTGVIGSIAGAILLLAIVTALGGGRQRGREVASARSSASGSGGSSAAAARKRKRSRGSKGNHRRNKRR